MKKNQITQINGFDISWHAESEHVKKLDEDATLSIGEAILEGCKDGVHTIIDSDTIIYWEIVDWKKLAHKLYNLVKGMEEGCQFPQKTIKGVIKEFETKWNQY